MARKKRQRISYVLPLASTPGGHRLGINGLAVDQDRSILYTGGRDGVICGWNVGDQPSTFRQEVQAHIHWVNDVCLVQNNEALVSASSDVTIKVWRPHGQEASSAQTIGSHSDYVKCLASPSSNANWVASGGLDHKICTWDLNGGGNTLEINLSKDHQVTKGSIYTLCANDSILASGGPESVVRLWDPKSGKNVTKLVGHTDNIRDILMTEDGHVLLSASADQTVKVWDITAGRCLHTLTMHNDSVWCMHSEDPQLSVFYSADRSGVVAKTDVRRANEFDEGVSLAICQDHEGVARIVTHGDSIWTASASSSVNRWKDVDTEADIETPPASPPLQRDRKQSLLSQEMKHDPADQEDSDDEEPHTNGTTAPKLPYTSILRLSVTASHPGSRNKPQSVGHSPPNMRKQSEAILDTDPGFTIPVRSQPIETIEGQNGLIKHAMLNDRKRVLTQDTAGEVILWDLLKCVPIRSYGKRHMEDVIPEVNTMESIANWCQVDTKTGKLAVMLEEIYCFDAEVYADETEIDEKIDFREDQRLNLGKWVLRNLFTTLLDEEIRRDEAYRRSLRSGGDKGSLQRGNVLGRIVMPTSSFQNLDATSDSGTTPRAANGLPPTTPGFPIGMASPVATSSDEAQHTDGQGEAAAGEDSATTPSQLPPTPGRSSGYFMSKSQAGDSEDTKPAVTPAPAPEPPATSTPASPTVEDKEEKKKSGIFGKKFNLSKTLGRKSADVKQLTSAPATDENKSEVASDKSSEKDTEPQVIEDNFYGVVQRIRHDYKEQSTANPDHPLNMGIASSLPIETPVLKPPPHTLVIIQEDDPDSGGVADSYRGEIGNLGREADILEKIAPMWLGDLLLKNQIPVKEPTKVSFILHPHPDSNPPLPSLAAPDGNARLNANRMLRAKKILAYVAERIDPPVPHPHPAGTNNTGRRPSQSQQQQQQRPSSPTQARTPGTPGTPGAPPPPSSYPTTTTQPQSPPPAPQQNIVQQRPTKPEDYLELFCQDKSIPTDMTLATLRVHVWRTGGDVVMYYRAKEHVYRKLRAEAGLGMPGEKEGLGGVVDEGGKAVEVGEREGGAGEPERKEE